MGNIAGIDHVQLVLPVMPEELGGVAGRRATLFDPFGNCLETAP